MLGRTTLNLPNYVHLQALLISGAIFKAAVPDESDEERRQLERYVLHCT